MAYHLKRDESVPEGVKRIARMEFDGAIESLRGGNRDAAVHEVRKSLKRVRALLRLVRPGMGALFRTENARLRVIGLKLSPVRDAAALIEAVDELKERCPQLNSVRRALVLHKRHVEEDLGIRDLLPRLADALGGQAKRARLWPLETDGFAAIEDGFQQAFRDGRKALVKYRRTSDREDLHEWRKRVKDHWYHIRLLEDLWTDVMKGYEAPLKELEDALGESLNLSLLRERIMAAPEAFGKPAAVERAVAAIDEEESRLRQRAMEIGARVYADKPRRLARWMADLWDAWKQEMHRPPIQEQCLLHARMPSGETKKK